MEKLEYCCLSETLRVAQEYPFYSCTKSLDLADDNCELRLLSVLGKDPKRLDCKLWFLHQVFPKHVHVSHHLIPAPYLFFFLYEKLFCEFANWFEKSKMWAWFVWFIFFSSREGIMHLEQFAACGAVMLLTFQPSDPHDFSMFHILPYLCCWTLWEKCVMFVCSRGQRVDLD